MKKSLLLIISLFLLMGCNNDKVDELVCSKNNNDDTKEEIIATFNNDVLENIEISVSKKIPDDSLATVYSVNLLEDTESMYENTDSVSVNTKVEDDIVTLITSINYKTFSTNDESVIDIKKDITFNELKKHYEDLEYICK